MIRGKEDITNQKFNKILLPFYDNTTEYLIKYIIPDYVAFYLANGYSRNCLSDCPIINHINSAIDVFNIQCNVINLIPTIEQILRIKFNLKIKNKSPLIITKFN